MVKEDNKDTIMTFPTMMIEEFNSLEDIKKQEYDDLKDKQWSKVVVEDTKVTKKETQDYPKGHNNIGIRVMFMIRVSI